MDFARVKLCVDACIGVSNADLAGLNIKQLIEADRWLLQRVEELTREVKSQHPGVKPVR